jgi:hypothetical protein
MVMNDNDNDNDNDNETDPILVKGNQIFFGCAAFFVFRFCFVSNSISFLLIMSLRDINVWINPMRQDQNQKFFARNLGQKRFETCPDH